MKVRLLAITLGGFALGGAGEVATGVEAEAYRALNENRYAQAEQLFAQKAFKPDCTMADEHAVGTVRYLREWMDGHYAPAAAIMPSFALNEAQSSAIARAEARDALDEIVRRAATTRVVILNEHHHVPRSRAFAAEVARRLRPLGFDILAAETFSNVPPGSDYYANIFGSFEKDGYPRQGTGFYSGDPVYGTFLREALALGYKPAAYETMNFDSTGTQEEQIARREQDQADNLAAILRAHPESKLFVYVGHSHLAEVPLGKTPWMAARLKGMTGIDPLTIDQAVFVGASLAVPHDPALAKLEAKASDRPVVLFDGDRPLVMPFPDGAVDLQVIHPVLPDVDGRPGWLFTSGRKAVTAPADLAPVDGDILLQAFGKTDVAQAIPIDQVVWRKGAPRPVLVLPPGDVRYVVQAMPEAVCPGADFPPES